MAEVVGDLVAEVEDERVRVGGAHELAAHSRHRGSACRTVAAANEAAHQVEPARRCARTVGGVAIGAEHAAFDDRDPLPAVQQLRGALFDRLAVRSTRRAAIAATIRSMNAGGSATAPPRTRREVYASRSPRRAARRGRRARRRSSRARRGRRWRRARRGDGARRRRHEPCVERALGRARLVDERELGEGEHGRKNAVGRSQRRLSVATSFAACALSASVMARLLASRRRINSTDACHRFLRLFRIGQDDARRAAHRTAAPRRPARLGRQARAPRVRHRPRRQGLVAPPPGRRFRGRHRIEPAPRQDPRISGPEEPTSTSCSPSWSIATGSWSRDSSTRRCQDRGLARGDRKARAISVRSRS